MMRLEVLNAPRNPVLVVRVIAEGSYPSHTQVGAEYSRICSPVILLYPLNQASHTEEGILRKTSGSPGCAIVEVTKIGIYIISRPILIVPWLSGGNLFVKPERILGVLQRFCNILVNIHPRRRERWFAVPDPWPPKPAGFLAIIPAERKSVSTIHLFQTRCTVAYIGQPPPNRR